MAAFDTFSTFARTLGIRERTALQDVESTVWADLLAARSEEARMRIVESFIREARELLRGRHA
jgi:hypothetical protein